MKTISTPRDLLDEESKDLPGAETHFPSGLLKMAEAPWIEEIRPAFGIRLEQTQIHAERLEEIARHLG